MDVRVESAVWDRRNKTAFLEVTGWLMVPSSLDEVEVTPNPNGLNPKILLLELTIKSGGGGMKLQPKRFPPTRITTLGGGEWTHVQAVWSNGKDVVSDIMPITVLTWAGDSEECWGPKAPTAEAPTS